MFFAEDKRTLVEGLVVYNRLIARDVMAAMLVVRNNKIFLLWELTSIFMQIMSTNMAAMQSTFRYQTCVVLQPSTRPSRSIPEREKYWVRILKCFTI